METGAIVASKTEKDIYAALDLPLIPPPLREDGGEIERAADGELPKLVQLKLTSREICTITPTCPATAGQPLAAMVEAAAARGYSYLAITDHGEDLTINGASPTADAGPAQEDRPLPGEVSRNAPPARL